MYNKKYGKHIRLVLEFLLNSLCKDIHILKNLSKDSSTHVVKFKITSLYCSFLYSVNQMQKDDKYCLFIANEKNWSNIFSLYHFVQDIAVFTEGLTEHRPRAKKTKNKIMKQKINFDILYIQNILLG